MKKLWILAAWLLCSGLISAQTDVSLTIKTVSKIEGMPAQIAGQMTQNTTTYVKGERYRTETTAMMTKSSSFFDGQQLIVLNETMGKKTGFTATKEELAAAETVDGKAPQHKVEYTNETKKVMDIECTKVIITTVDEKKREEQLIAWVTDKFNIPRLGNAGSQGNMMQAAYMGDMKGYPLELEMNIGTPKEPMKMVITTTEIKFDALDDALFKANTDGYSMTTYADFMKKAQSMMGGY